MKLLLTMMLLLLGIVGFLLHLDHRTTFNGINQLGKDSSYLTLYAKKNMPNLPRPGWSADGLFDEWHPQFNKSEFLVKEDCFGFPYDGSSMQLLLRSNMFDLKGVDVGISFNSLKPPVGLGFVLKVIYVEQINGRFEQKVASSGIHIISKGSNDAMVAINDGAEWGYLEVILTGTDKKSYLDINGKISSYFVMKK